MVEKLVLGRFEEMRNGVPLQYRIETVSAEQVQPVINHMVEFFLKREPLTTYDGLYKDEPSVNSFITLWRKTLETGTPIVAVEERDEDEINIVGANITLVQEKDQKEDKQYKGEAFNKILKVTEYITQKNNIYKRYNVEKYLSAIGLAVHADYHGYNIGYRLLSSREPLCKVLGLEATGTIFTAKAAQHIAAKAGFEILAEEHIDTFKMDGEYVYKEGTGSLVNMGKKYSF